MVGPSIDVVGVGNAIVDVIAEVGHAFIDDHELVKNSMTLIDLDRANELEVAMPSGITASGGSAANTMVGVAGFGGIAAYLGLVADDDLGEAFRSDLRAAGVGFDVPGKVDGLPTARCLIQVTPDAQRTLNTYLGVSAHLSPDEIDEALVASASHLYCEGYLWDMEPAKAGIRHAMDVAARAGRTVSLTLSDSFCVNRHRDEWRELIVDRVDVVFGNADELRALYEVDALALAADGARVWVCDRTTEELDETAAAIEQAGGQVQILRFDLTEIAACHEAITEVKTKAVHLQVLVNAAAVLKEAEVAKTSFEDWTSTLAINLTAPFVLTQGFLPNMLEKGGSVINVSSRAGIAPFRGEAAYCASKYGLEALTKCLALEFDTLPLSVNTITPGLHIKPTGLTDKQTVEATPKQQQQWADPLELAPAFTFLARLTGEVQGLRFNGERLSAALNEEGVNSVLARINELAE